MDNIIKTLKNEENLTAAGGMNGEEIREAAKTLGMQIDDKVSNEDLEKNLKLGTEKIKAMNDDEIKSSLKNISGGELRWIKTYGDGRFNYFFDYNDVNDWIKYDYNKSSFKGKMINAATDTITSIGFSTNLLVDNVREHPIFCTGVAATIIGGTHIIKKV